MADVKGKISSSSESEACIDEFKAEDYNFYVLNSIMSQNIILQNYLNEEGTVNALKESFTNFTAASDPCEVLPDSEQVKTGISLTSTVAPDLQDKSAKNEFQGQPPRITLKDTFLEDVLSTSTKSFIERVSKSHFSKKTLKKPLSNCLCNNDRSADSNGSLSRTPPSRAVLVSNDLKHSASTTTLTLNESCTNTSPSTVNPGTKSHPQEEKKHNNNSVGRNESRTLPQKRKEKSHNKKNACNAQKKVKMFSSYSTSSSQNIINSECRQELNCITATPAVTVGDEAKSIGSISLQNTDNKNQQPVENMRRNNLNEAQTFVSVPSKSNSNNYKVVSDIPSDDFEWSMENLQFFGLALPEDSSMDTLKDKSDSCNKSFSCHDTCPHGCRDLMSSEHLYHLHLSALKLSQNETQTAETFAETAKFKNDLLCHMKNRILVESKGNNRSLEYQQNENTQEKNIKINSEVIGNKPIDVIINNADPKDISNKVILNGIRRETILKGHIKLCDQVACQFCEKSDQHMLGKPPVPVHCVRNLGNKAVPQAISCSNVAYAGMTPVSLGTNDNNMTAQSTGLSNNSYNIAPASASSHFYKPSGIYGFGNLASENYIHLEPFTMPSSSMWFGKQPQQLNNPFNATNVSPHVMNSPWYQQWFHAMSMKRPLASQVPSTPCNYFEPLKMNHYRKTLWGTPNVGQQRMHQRTTNTMSSLPRMFQTPFLHSCFPATMSCGDYHTASHIQYAEQQAERVAASHSQVSVETNKESNFEAPGKS